MDGILFQATIYLVAAICAVPLASRLGLGSVLGYLIAGIAIGPLLGIVGSETQELQHFAEFGVVMMLFLIGLELEPRALWEMRARLIGMGGLQIVLTMGAVMAGAMALGQMWSVALTLGMIFSLSSTAIVLQTLNEKGLMHSGGGRSAFSVLLTQDIAVIPMLAVMPLLVVAEFINHDGGHAAAHGMSLVEGLPAWGVTLVTLGAVAAVILAGMFLTRPLFQFIHMADQRELYTAAALLIVIGIALLMMLVGLSPALGTFLAGMLLANSEFRHELEANIEPFKGLLLGLFFITVGAGINFATLFADPLTIVGLTLAVMTLKAAILYGIGRLFGLKRYDQWLFTLSLAQAGEFGFVLVSFALQQSVLPGPLGELVLLIVALSMLLTPLIFLLFDQIARRFDGEADETPTDEVNEANQIIIAGIGRFGQVVNRVVQMSGFSTTVLDNDLNTIQLMRRFGFKGYFGDPTRPEMLHAAGLATARVLVVAMDDREATLKLVHFARKERPDLHIVARARDRVHVYELFQAGANDIVREMFDSSLRAGRYVLEHMGLSDGLALEQQNKFYRMDRRAMQELAELWVPGVPVSKNKAYVERAKELNRDLETALVTQLDDQMATEDVDPKRG